MKATTPAATPAHVPSRAHAAPHSRRGTILAAALGNALEFFDFTVYSFFAAIIGTLYFPASDPLGSLLLSLATFGVGFVARPIGAVLIGAYADLAGRKRALVLTVALMAAGTAVIGLAPTYASIGLAAPILIVLGRVMQGFSAGGEAGAATTLLMESGAAGERGYLVSWQLASQGAALLAGGFAAAVLTHTLSHDDLMAWGWRVPFLAGLVIGPVGLYLRRRLHETLHADAGDAVPTAGEGTVGVSVPTARVPVTRVRLSWRTIVAGTLLVIGGTASTYVIAFFLPAYLTLTKGMAPGVSSLIGVAAGLVMMIGSPLAGRFADRIGRQKPLLYATSVISLGLLFPAFAMINAHPSLPVVIGVVVALIGLMTLASPVAFVMILEALPACVRATSLGIIYAVGVTLFGGFAQLIVGWLWRSTGNFYAPAWYVFICTIASLIGVILFPAAKKGIGRTR